ncbi:MAG: DUF2442 domain-containing protein [bacterium]|nr:DUF2442 domain-containing protein [bacterium]
MLRDIVEVPHLGGYRVFLRFDDVVSGELDLSSLISFDGVFEPLKDVSYFAKVAVHPELGTIFWPNGADLDPVVLYYRVKGEAIPNFREI